MFPGGPLGNRGNWKDHESARRRPIECRRNHPAASSTERADETVIMSLQRCPAGRGWCSPMPRRYQPTEWAKTAISVYPSARAQGRPIVAEVTMARDGEATLR